MRRNERSQVVVGGTRAACLLFAASLILAGSGCGDSGTRTNEPQLSPSEKLLAELKDQKQEIDETTDRMIARIAEFNQSRGPQQPEITFSEVFLDDLSGEQKDVLNQLIAEEKNPSYRTLLEQIVDDRAKIQSLQDRVGELEQTLPDSFVVARQGDSHQALAMEYLTSTEGMEKAKAQELIRQVDRTDELLPGNKVWFSYDRDRDFFRTYVTMGEAGQTPLLVRRALRQQLLADLDEATRRGDELEQDNVRLAADVATLETDVASLERQRAGLETEVNGLERARAELRTEVAGLEEDVAHMENRLSYHTATQRDLRDADAVSLVRKELRDVAGIEFDDELDLRRSETITLKAADLGLSAIRKVRLLPSIYVEGRDYAIERSEDGATASVVIKQRDLFRGKEVLLSVSGPSAERT